MAPKNTASTTTVARAAPAAAPAAKTVRAKKSPVAASPAKVAPSSVPEAVAQPSVKVAAALKATAAAVKAPKVAKASKVTAAVSEAVKAPRTKRTQVAPPISPRTANSRLAAKGVDVMTYREVRATADALSKNVDRLVTIAVGVAKKGEFEYGGKTYSATDVRAERRSINQAIRKIPVASRQSTRRGAVVISEDERQVRVKALYEKACAGVDELTSVINIPKLKTILRANELARIEAMKKPSTPGTSTQITATFLIADPLREFIRNANLGNGIALLFSRDELSDETRRVSGAENPEAAIAAVSKDLGKDCVAELGITKANALALADPRQVLSPLIIERGIATSPLLMSIMACYVAANGLKNPDGRIRIDENMRRHFGSGNTRWTFAGRDLTPETASADVDLSGIERLKRRQPTKPGDPTPCDGKTFIRSMSIALASMYRIANAPEDLSADLQNPRVTALANGVKAYV